MLFLKNKNICSTSKINIFKFNEIDITRNDEVNDTYKLWVINKEK